MTYPRREPTGRPALDLFSVGALHFEKEDQERFPALRLARECLQAGGAACTILNGANEVANEAFRQGRIPFGRITETVEHVLDKLPPLPAGTLEDIYEADRLAREAADAFLM
ncbi:MAG: 1-deoxy-D-xylulose-5-phosphate reductoisomerase, partial [Clostridia bacterium]|nr:1-deoxy-D-xylulose-5-phosphate reductoisomerase [Clostridia bacterium]